jgi:hypothetical protein
LLLCGHADKSQKVRSIILAICSLASNVINKHMMMMCRSVAMALGTRITPTSWSP